MTQKSILFILSLSLLAGLRSASALPQASNDDCLTCHSDSSLKSSSGKPLFVDQDKFKASVHGQAEIACIDCHTDLKRVKDFPHPEKLQPVNCAACHE